MTQKTIEILTNKVYDFVGKTNRVFLDLRAIQARDGIKCHKTGLMEKKLDREIDIYVADDASFDEIYAEVEIELTRKMRRQTQFVAWEPELQK